MGLIFGKYGKKLNLMQCYVLEFMKHNENRSYSASFSLYDGHISKYNIGSYNNLPRPKSHRKSTFVLDHNRNLYVIPSTLICTKL